KTMGKPVLKVNGRDIVTGRHRHTPDHTLPGALFGKVLRPPSYGAKLQSLDDSAAKAMPGVTVVREGEFAGIAAPDAQTAARALAALKAEWSGAAHPSSRELYRYLRENANGSLPTAKAVYEIAYIAHVPLEPRAALAEWKDGKLTVWTGTQRPFGVKG